MEKPEEGWPRALGWGGGAEQHRGGALPAAKAQPSGQGGAPTHQTWALKR